MQKICLLLLVCALLAPAILISQDRGLTLLVKDLGTNARAGRQYLLLIAVDKYQAWTPLKNPVKDARAIRDVLTSRYYIDETIELLDAQATKANILKTFTGLQSRLQVNDSLLVYYAGHGHLDTATNSGFWIPVNAGTDKFEQANWLPNNQIRGLISNMKSIHVLIVSDSCFSGDLLNSSRGLADEISIDYFKKAYSRISRQILTSGASETVPDESEFARMFKMSLLKNNSPYFDPLMLFNDIRLGVRNTMPMFGNLKDTGHQEGASFLLFLKEEKPVETVKKEEPKKDAPKKEQTTTETPRPEKKTDVIVETAVVKSNRPALLFEDTFDSQTLDPRWSWVRESPQRWSLKDKPGYLALTAVNGNLHQGTNNSRNILLTPMSAADFTLETKIDFVPYDNYQQAGLIVYRDDDNYVRLNTIYADRKKIEMIYEVKGEYQYVNVPNTLPRVYLRLKKTGDQFTASFSGDGTTYTDLAPVTALLGGPLKAGLACDNADSTYALTASLDYFRCYAPPAAVPAVGGFRDEFTSSTLDKRWSWVREKADDWNLTKKPGYLSITADRGELNRNNNRNLLLTPAPAGDFIIETELAMEPSANYQLGGLVVYQDDDNYVRMSLTYADGKVAEIVREQKGAFTVDRKKPVLGNPLVLRLVRSGNRYTGYVRRDGGEDLEIGSLAMSLQGNLKIGIIACSTEANARVTAAFNYISLSPVAK